MMDLRSLSRTELERLTAHGADSERAAAAHELGSRNAFAAAAARASAKPTFNSISAVAETVNSFSRPPREQARGRSKVSSAGRAR